MKKGNAALKEEVKRAIRILLSYVEYDTQRWVEEYAMIGYPEGLAGMDGRSEWNKYL